jgi:hypothetical protein
MQTLRHSYGSENTPQHNHFCQQAIVFCQVVDTADVLGMYSGEFAVGNQRDSKLAKLGVSQLPQMADNPDVRCAQVLLTVVGLKPAHRPDSCMSSCRIFLPEQAPATQ